MQAIESAIAASARALFRCSCAKGLAAAWTGRGLAREYLGWAGSLFAFHARLSLRLGKDDDWHAPAITCVNRESVAHRAILKSSSALDITVVLAASPGPSSAKTGGSGRFHDFPQPHSARHREALFSAGDV